MEGKMKVPKLRFPEFEGEWEIKKVEQILKRVGKPVNVENDQKYQQIGIRSHGKGLFHKELVTGEELGGKRVFWVVPDSFIVNIVFAWEQAVAKTTSFEEGMIASHRFPMFQSQEKHPVDLDFVLHFFLTKKGKVILEAASPGGAGRNKTLGQKEFERQKLLYPSLPEQQKIATFLTTIDTRIQQLSRKKALLEQYKKGVMQQIFSQEIRFKDEDGKEFPAWEEKRLGDLCSTFKSGIGITSENIYEIGEFAVYGGNGLRGYTNVYTHEGFFVLIGRQGALCGNVNRVMGKSYISEHAIAVSGNELSDTEWLAQRLDFWKLNRLSESSAQPGLAVNKLIKLNLTAPSLPEQQKIAAFLSTLDRQINLVSQQLERMQTFKKGLLQQMFV